VCLQQETFQKEAQLGIVVVLLCGKATQLVRHSCGVLGGRLVREERGKRVLLFEMARLSGKLLWQ
jgi:hypothetical protein